MGSNSGSTTYVWAQHQELVHLEVMARLRRCQNLSLSLSLNQSPQWHPGPHHHCTGAGKLRIIRGHVVVVETAGKAVVEKAAAEEEDVGARDLYFRHSMIMSSR